MTSPIEFMVAAAVKCTKCGTLMSVGCDCWVKPCPACGKKRHGGAATCAECWCGTVYLIGKRCPNKVDHGPFIVEKIGCACERQFDTREACGGGRVPGRRCSCPCHRKDARGAYAEKLVAALPKPALVFVVPSGGAQRAKALRRALATLKQLAEVDPERARMALADVEASGASHSFKRRARRALEEVLGTKTKEPAGAGAI